MEKPSSGFSFPMRLGFGCSGAWAQSWFAESQAQAIVRRAFDDGVRCFDTAGFYAGGEAERRLGAALKDFNEPVFVSTKTGTSYHATGARKDFSERAIRSDVEASLKRLKREQLDLLYLHGPSPAEQDAGLEALAKLKAEGKVALIGVCGEGEGLARAVEAPSVDVIMGAYNIFRREHIEVFSRAKKRNMGVVAIAPLAQGLYRRDLFVPKSLADGWHLARALVKNRDELSRARKAREMLSTVDGWSPAQLALAFVHANSDIDVAITTTTKTTHLAESVTAASRTVPAEIVELLAALSP